MKNTLRIVVATALIALITLFCFYIWPTRYFYDKIETGQSAVYLRIDRFTGEVSRLDLSNNTWVTARMLADRDAELKAAQERANQEKKSSETLLEISERLKQQQNQQTQSK
jgi:hypothetical protein